MVTTHSTHQHSPALLSRQPHFEPPPSNNSDFLTQPQRTMRGYIDGGHVRDSTVFARPMFHMSVYIAVFTVQIPGASKIGQVTGHC
jgi:hypothetical protein